MTRKFDINTIGLTIDSIQSNNNSIIINWSSDIGYGQYDIEVDNKGSIVGRSESMDSNDDKEFLKKLLSLLVDRIQIKS